MWWLFWLGKLLLSAAEVAGLCRGWPVNVVARGVVKWESLYMCVGEAASDTRAVTIEPIHVLGIQAAVLLLANDVATKLPFSSFGFSGGDAADRDIVQV